MSNDAVHGRVPDRDPEDELERLRAENDALRRQLAAVERQHQARLETILAPLPVGVWLSDAEGRLYFGNEAGRRIWAGAEYVGLEQYGEYRAWRYGTGEPVAPDEWAAARAITRGDTTDGELLEIQCFDGSRKVIRNSAAPFLDEAGRILGAVVLNEDVTQEMAAERQRADHAQRLQELVIALSRVLAEETVDGLVREVASAACALTRAGLGTAGFEPLHDGFRGGATWTAPGRPSLPPDEVFLGQPGGLAHELARSGERVRLGAEACKAHVQLSGAGQGGEGLNGLLAVPLRDAVGRPAGLVLVADREEDAFSVEDEVVLTQLALFASLALRQIAARRELDETNRHKDAFLSMLSHELRNPLAPMRNALALLERAPQGSEASERALTILGRQLGHVSRLVDDLLDASRIARGRLEIHPAPLDLRELVAHTGEDLRVLLDQYGMALEVDLDRGPLFVSGDRTRLAQVVGNLLQNASKFGRRGGRVQLSLHRDEGKGQAVLRVRDDGIGIDPELVPRLFDPFVQAEAALDRTRGGLGLGLALVKSLVELHGGAVEAHSEGEGAGAEFTVRLPLSADEGPDATETERADTTGGRRVLLVEDNVDAADTLRDLLELLGHSVTVTYSSRKALEVAFAQPPEVVLCDVGLPDVDGYEVARRLRDDPRTAGAVLVALTGYALPEDRRRAEEAGFDHHVAKPPDLDAIERILASGR